ncbi:MAG TPA: AraC family transcriptional regulator [Firmicutes bacterium]|nr:AraC family transcriptional regulator [Bacillota bacterium]
MREWNREVQAMIDWIEEHLRDSPTLDAMAEHLHYSRFYCSRLFRQTAGVTLRQYLAGRRLYGATIAVRDTQQPIVDIALEYGYSSQSALTRAFQYAYGCTPAAYRSHPVPIPLTLRKVVLEPSYFIRKGVVEMSEYALTKPEVWVEYIPAHTFIGLYDPAARGYWDFESRPDFGEVEGTIESIVPFQDPVVWAHHAGWFYPDGKDGKRGYFYGAGVSPDYDGPIPAGFASREIPGSYYLVFGHPKYDYADNGEVMKRVEDLAWSFDPRSMGYEWNEDACQDYQRHMWNSRGYQVLRPIRKP